MWYSVPSPLPRLPLPHQLHSPGCRSRGCFPQLLALRKAEPTGPPGCPQPSGDLSWHQDLSLHIPLLFFPPRGPQCLYPCVPPPSPSLLAGTWGSSRGTLLQDSKALCWASLKAWPLFLSLLVFPLVPSRLLQPSGHLAPAS